MLSKEVVIVPKISHLDWDSQQNHLTHKEMVERYVKEGIDPTKIIESHKRQKESLRELKKIFRKSRIVSRDNISRQEASNAEMVIAIGGDGHFSYVSHFVDSQLMVGVNSDPQTSVGALCNFSIHNFDKLAKSLSRRDFTVEERARVQATLNGTRIASPAISDIFIGETNRLLVSRYILNVEGQLEEQKSSGLIVSTGSGMTGWYDAISRYLERRPKDQIIAEFLEEGLKRQLERQGIDCDPYLRKMAAMSEEQLVDIMDVILEKVDLRELIDYEEVMSKKDKQVVVESLIPDNQAVQVDRLVKPRDLGLTERKIRFAAAELYDNSGKKHYSLRIGDIDEGKELIIKSLINNNGIVAIDSLNDSKFIHQFSVGSEVRLCVADQSLRVVTE